MFHLRWKKNLAKHQKVSKCYKTDCSVTGFQYKFDVIWEIWLPWVLIWLKVGHYRARKVRLARQRRKNDVTQQLQIKISESSLDLIRGFLFQIVVIWNVWLPLVIILVKNGHCKTTNVRLTGQRKRNDVTQQLITKIFWKLFGSS